MTAFGESSQRELIDPTTAYPRQCWRLQKPTAMYDSPVYSEGDAARDSESSDSGFRPNQQFRLIRNALRDTDDLTVRTKPGSVSLFGRPIRRQ
jgi:hypothetical protein